MSRSDDPYPYLDPIWDLGSGSHLERRGHAEVELRRAGADRERQGVEIGHERARGLQTIAP